MSVLWENDLFTGRDGQYTSGVRLYWISRDLRGDELSAWTQPIAGLLPLGPEGAVAHNIGFSVSHVVYTPDDTKTSTPASDDRPYAGHFSLGASLLSRTATRLDMLELNLGLVGPASLAADLQKRVHRVIGARHPRGWGHQLPNEPTGQLVYERRWRTGERDLFNSTQGAVIPHAGLSIGTVAAYAHAGARLKIGKELAPDFGVGAIHRPGGSPAPPHATSGADRQGAHLFFGFDGRAVAHDIFLDGNTFRSSPSVKREPLVADLFAGFEADLSRVRLSYAVVWRSREFTTQSRPHLFGSLSASYSY